MFNKIIEAFKKRLEEKRKKQMVEESEELFDIGVREDLIWFYYNGEPVCPMSLFSVEEPAALIMVMRDMYIKRKSKQ